MADPPPVLVLPERQVPVPKSVSAEAQAVLAMPAAAPTEYPQLDDVPAWKEMIASHDQMIEALVGGRADESLVKVEHLQINGVAVFQITPAEVDDSDDRVYLDIHGGGFIYGAGASCRAMAIGTAVRMGARVWAVDYRMPPDHPFPAGLDDCVAVYRALLEDRLAERIVIGGASAGGNLAAALTLRSRDEGLPLPAAVVLMTPAVDLTESGDSYQTNQGLDPLLRGSAKPAFLLYAGGHDLDEPYVSPINGSFTKGFPPTILTTGTRDLLLSDTVRMHRALRKAGVRADLHVTEAAGHGGFLGMAPEDTEIMTEVRLFVDNQWSWS